MLATGRIISTGSEADAAVRKADERNKSIIFKNCAAIINCKIEINNT